MHTVTQDTGTDVNWHVLDQQGESVAFYESLFRAQEVAAELTQEKGNQMPPPNKNGTEVVVTSLPPCDIHPERQAAYDFKTRNGPWMHGCPACFRQYGGRLGLGKGQRLVLAPPAE